MKKNRPPATAPSPGGFWRNFALLLLVTNAALLVWAWRAKHTPPPPAATTSGPAAAAPALPRELSPYAALGSFMAENNRVSDLGWNKAQFAAFQEGFRLSFEGRGLPLDDAAKRLRDDVSSRVQTMMQSEQPDPIQEYFKTLREKEGVKSAPSGLHYRITEEGNAESPTATSTVVISFSARLPDGSALPALSKARVRVPVKDLLPGLTEGVQLLKVGGKALVYLPPELSFSTKNWPEQLPRGAPIVFFLELHDVIAASP